MAGDKGPIGVLALQGSFALHAAALRKAGASVREVRKPEDLEGLRGLILPGGESTVMAELGARSGVFDRIRDKAREGLPIFGTCAGAILLGKGDERPPRLGLVDVGVVRNAYGRQVDSFDAEIEIAGLDRPFHAIFIRAPKLRRDSLPRDAEVLAVHGEDPVLVRAGRCLLATFHPELTGDLRVHELFLGMT